MGLGHGCGEECLERRLGSNTSGVGTDNVAVKKKKKKGEGKKMKLEAGESNFGVG